MQGINIFSISKISRSESSYLPIASSFSGYSDILSSINGLKNVNE